MTVEELIKFLEKEIQDEEVLFLLPSGKEMALDGKPPRHAGPKTFIDKEGKRYSKSTVLIWLKDYE